MGTFTFTTTNRDEALRILCATEAYGVIWDLLEKIREIEKHSGLSETASNLLDVFSKTIIDKCEEYGVNLDNYI